MRIQEHEIRSFAYTDTPNCYNRITFAREDSTDLVNIKVQYYEDHKLKQTSVFVLTFNELKQLAKDITSLF